jgi:hypothetical protein
MKACGIGDYSVSLWLRRITCAWFLLCIISMTKFHTSCQLIPDHDGDWIPGQLVVQEMLGNKKHCADMCRDNVRFDAGYLHRLKPYRYIGSPGKCCSHKCHSHESIHFDFLFHVIGNERMAVMATGCMCCCCLRDGS